MLPRNERNTDSDDRLRRRQLQPVFSIAVERETAREKDSQALIDSAIQIEQIKLKPTVKVQRIPGEPETMPDNVEKIIASSPQKMVNPVNYVPRRTTISGVMKEKMGVANRRARTKRGAIPLGKGRFEYHPVKSSPGGSVNEKKVNNTPVTRLTFIDQFFNWLNGILR